MMRRRITNGYVLFSCHPTYGCGTTCPNAVCFGRSTRIRPYPPSPPLVAVVGSLGGGVQPPPLPAVAVISPPFSNSVACKWMLPPLPPPLPLPWCVPESSVSTRLNDKEENMSIPASPSSPLHEMVPWLMIFHAFIFKAPPPLPPFPAVLGEQYGCAEPPEID